MAISATTDWAKMRHIMQMVFFTSALLASTVGQGLPTSGKHKRQLFREHLLPARGGKIPQDAFLLDRISLNRLNQIGAFNSEGNLLERPPLEGVRYHDQLAKTIKIIVPPVDNRFVNPAGRYNRPHIADTTYLIRETSKFKPFPALNARFPIIPYSSLQLIRYHQQKRKWDNSGFTREQIFTDLAPYVRKLHELDGYRK